MAKWELTLFDLDMEAGTFELELEGKPKVGGVYKDEYGTFKVTKVRSIDEEGETADVDVEYL